jgi:hypothetical protein
MAIRTLSRSGWRKNPIYGLRTHPQVCDQEETIAAFEEVIGSIPIRSTNQTNNLGRSFPESAEPSSNPPPAAGRSLSSVILGLQGNQNEIEGKDASIGGNSVFGNR